jgi:hypothetical protein
MKTVIYPQENNRLAIMAIIDDKQSIEEVVRKSVPENVPYTVVENLQLDPDFLDAYEYRDGQAVINYEWAKEIQKNKWRQLRKPILEKLDVEFMKALETGNTNKVQEIGSQKQELRDITKTQLIDNLDDIKNAMPNILQTL